MRSSLSALLALSLLCASQPLSAQLMFEELAPRRVEPPKPQTSKSLRDRTGSAAAERALRDSELEPRLRALVKLGGAAGPRGVDTLVQRLSASEGLATAEERLTAVRVLARHTRRPKVRQALLRVLGGLGDERRSDLDEMARQTAALALAKSQHPEALDALAKIIRQESFGAEATRGALLAYPPRNLGRITRGGGSSTNYIRLLGELGDQRGFHPLRDLVRRGSAEQRGLAAFQLTRLGAFETVPLAKRWLADVPEQQPGRDERALLSAAARILTASRDDAYPKAIRRLLDSEDWALGVELAELAPSPGLVGSLEKRLKQTDGDARGEILAAIGAVGGPRATKLLKAELETGDVAAAALALAGSTDDEATQALRDLLKSPKARASAARALTLRRALGHSTDGSLHAVWLELLVSKIPAERAAAAFGLAAESDEQAVELLGRKDPVVVVAAARTALGRPAVLAAAARRLAHEQSAQLRAALAISLVSPTAAALVPTSVLLELVHAGGAAMHVAAFALAVRDEAVLKPELARWLGAGSPELRGSVGLGLGHSPRSGAVGQLTSAYRFETDARVRLALVQGAGTRAEPTAARLLKLAANLDPDATVRNAARRLLRQPGSPRAFGRSATWLELGGGQGVLAVSTQAAPAIPLVPDPDGQCPVIGLPEGGIEVSASPTR